MINLKLKELSGFIGRFTVVHVVTYFAFSIVFSSLMGYAEHWASVYACFMRPFDDPLVMAGPLFQLIRGPILALAFYPFRGVILEGRWGWLKLWFALWTLTAIGAVVPSLYNIEGIIYAKHVSLQARLLTVPDWTLQMLAFSGLFYIWERSKDRRITIPLIAALIAIIALLLLGILTSY
ncbi:MAG: hypothetical protein NWF08_02920 [Candidatus Bathyarchaeota archaeon]|nr:hypothetical protein [Candidatus Bathyarchaeota archaeon]